VELASAEDGQVMASMVGLRAALWVSPVSNHLKT